MAVRKQPIKTNNLKVRVAGSNVTNRCDDGKIDGVSWRNNLTLLELFTSGEGFISLACTCAQNSGIKVSPILWLHFNFGHHRMPLCTVEPLWEYI